MFGCLLSLAGRVRGGARKVEVGKGDGSSEQEVGGAEWMKKAHPGGHL